jgi:glucosylceramidase
MQAQGIRIAAITPQNEPLNPDNTPSMVMSAEQEAAFIKQALGPTFREQGLKTAIIIYDHNCDRPDYPLTILGDKEAAQYVDGSGFHLYGGEVGAMTQVHDAFPEKNIYFTEQMVVDDPATGPELHIAEPVSRVVIGATSNWARNVLLWNLAADPGFGPHTNDGGCPVCEGAITLDGDSVTRNLGYYTIAQIARFVPPGSVHILTTAMHEAPGAEARLPSSVAFHTPDGKTVLLVANPSSSPAHFAIHARHKAAEATLAPGAAATFVW